MEAAEKCIPSKLKSKHTLSVKKKRDNVKTASLGNKRNATNANAKKLNKTQIEQTHRPDH